MPDNRAVKKVTIFHSINDAYPFQGSESFAVVPADGSSLAYAGIVAFLIAHLGVNKGTERAIG